MSILAVSAPPDPIEEITAAQIVFAVFLFAAPLVVAVAAGVFRPKRLTLPDRLIPGRPAWPLLVLMMVAAAAWILSSAVYGTWRALELRQTATTQPFVFDVSMLTGEDYAILDVGPPVVGMLVLLAGSLSARLSLTRRLGLAASTLPRGLLGGVVGMLLVTPLIFGASILVEALYRAVGFKHPNEHELLRVLGGAGEQWVRIALILGAAVVAPLWEELLFRGLLQSLLRRGFLRMATEPPAQAGFPVAAATIGVGGGPPGPLPPPPVPAIPYATPQAAETESLSRLPAWPSWAAIILTSLGFAFVHDLWTAPPIFLLSLCLGYAYERTGNLWVPIVMHAVFNSLQTTLYLLFYT